MTTLKPPRLHQGDLIGLVSPASTPSASEKIEKGVAYLERLGYRVAVGKHVMDSHGYLAGSDKVRADEFNAMAASKEIKAIFCTRGGYGTPRILPLINYGALKRNPKIIVGYSDITALQLAILRKTGLVTFSGPMVCVEMWKGMDPFTEEWFWRTLTSPKPLGELPNPPGKPIRLRGAKNGTGRMIGGNMALLLSVFGTPYMPSLRDAILFLEDVDEQPHRIDRMFTQLRNGGVLKSIAGLVLGTFTECAPSDPKDPHLTAEQVLEEYTGAIAAPVLSEFQYGHIPVKATLPLGVRSRLNVKQGGWEVLEGAVR